MPSNRPVSLNPTLLNIFATIVIIFGFIILYLGEIWIAPFLITLGLGLHIKHWIFSKSPKELKDPEESIENGQDIQSTWTQCISFWNFPVSRILVIIIILILAIIDAILFRTPIVDRYNPIGSWQILMGPTLFYPLVFLPLLITFGMILHLLFSIRKITLTRMEKVVTIQERGLIRFTNKIPFDNVIETHFRSNTTGLKAIWLIPWSIQIWGNFASAWHYYTNEFTFGTGVLIGPVYLLHSFIYLIILFLLLFSPEYEFGWKTASQEFYLRWFSFRFLNKFPKEKIITFFSTNNLVEQECELTSRDRKRKTYYISVGIILLGMSFFSIAIPFFFSDIPRVFLFMGAIASLSVALKDYGINLQNRNLFGYLNYRNKISNHDTTTDKSQHTSLEIMVYITEILQICSIGVILTTKWRIYPLNTSSSSILWFDLLTSSILSIFILFIYLKKKWDIIEDSNRAAQVGGIIVLIIAILLSFIL